VADVAWDSPGMLLLVLSVEGKLAVFSRDGLVARVVARQVVVYPLRARGGAAGSRISFTSQIF